MLFRETLITPDDIQEAFDRAARIRKLSQDARRTADERIRDAKELKQRVRQQLAIDANTAKGAGA